MANLYISFNAVFPFIFYMSFGALVVKKGITDDIFMKKLNQMIFKLFFPQMMFYNIYSQKSNLHLNGKIIYICVISEVILIAIVWIIVPMIVKENKKRGVLIQALYRTNTILFAIPLTENLFGAEGAALASTVIAVVVPIYNIVAVILLEYYRGGKTDYKSLIIKIIKNPLIIGAIVALLFIRFNVEVPNMILKPISQFSSMTSPLALFVLGGTLKLSSIRNDLKVIIVTVFTKMIVFPAIAIWISVLFQMGAMDRFEYFSLFAAPIAVSSYSMAENMGGDGNLAGELVVFSTIISLFTLFGWIFFMKSTGLI